MKGIKQVLAAAASTLALAATHADAALILTLDDLSTAGVDVTVTDDLPGDALLGFAGVVGYYAGVGTWFLSSTTGFGHGTSEIFGIDLNSLSVSSRTGGTLRLTMTETDLSFGAPGTQLLNIGSLIGGTTQGTVSYSAWFDDSNAAFGKATQLFAGTATSGAFSAGNTTPVAATNPFSLTLIADITHTGQHATSFDFAAQVPEPGTLALVGLGLIGAGLSTRKRQQA